MLLKGCLWSAIQGDIPFSILVVPQFTVSQVLLVIFPRVVRTRVVLPFSLVPLVHFPFGIGKQLQCFVFPTGNIRISHCKSMEISFYLYGISDILSNFHHLPDRFGPLQLLKKAVAGNLGFIPWGEWSELTNSWCFGSLKKTRNSPLKSMCFAVHIALKQWFLGDMWFLTHHSWGGPVMMGI